MAKSKYDRGFWSEWGLSIGISAVLIIVLAWALIWGMRRFYENKDACERLGMVYLSRDNVCVQGTRP